MKRIGPLDQALNIVGEVGSRLFDNHVRLAITGLRRSGKTVFTTAFVHHLLQAHDLDFMSAAHQDRFLGARVVDGLGERFPFESFETDLLAEPPRWPEATDRLTSLRLEMRYRASGFFSSLRSSVQTLVVDIIDYPGEWLLDLPLVATSFAQLSRDTLALAERHPRSTVAREWLDQIENGDTTVLIDSYRRYLERCQHELGLSFVQPGRLMHGLDDLPDGATFSPVPSRHRLEAEMAHRYQRYVEEVVKPFYYDHFSNFDRQIVLVDLFTCLNAGPAWFDDSMKALSTILESFTYGQGSWLRRLVAPRIDKVLFAASKADHVAANQHPNLKQLLELMVEPASRRARFEGISQDVLALSALRCTDTVTTEHQGQLLSCVRGKLKNEDRETVLFPGEIPPELPSDEDWQSGRFRFHDFAPRRLKRRKRGQHVRLDQAIEFLLGDKLA
ncbi:MAG: YcjX family protein [Geminicoccaceae bacterium]|nr:YcjX family protein [Geminicoccaceae bacterium]